MSEKPQGFVKHTPIEQMRMLAKTKPIFTNSGQMRMR
jgi:hypothetical protein